MHYDQQAIFEDFIIFQGKNSEGVEVTESDLLEAWQEARKITKYFK